MDKKPGEELASTLDANPSEPIAPAEPIAAPTTGPAPVAEPVAAVPAPTAPVAPAPTAPAAVAPKKKKTGLIIGLIAGILVAAGGGTAAAIFLLNKNNTSGPANPDQAIADTLESVVAGKINSFSFDGEAKISNSSFNASFTFDGAIAGKEGKGNISADVSASGMNLTGGLSAVVKDNYAYIKADGVKKIIDTFYLSSMLGTSSANKLKAIDGNWYKLSLSLSEATSSIEGLFPSSNSNCSVNVNDLIEKIDSISELYKSHSFVKAEKYTGNDVKKKKSDVYKLSIDEEKLKEFASAVSKRVYDSSSRCQITYGGNALGEDSGIKLFAEFDKNAISRLYAVLDKDGTSASADINLNINGDVKIEAPANVRPESEFKEALEPIFSSIFSSMFGGTSYGGSSYGGGSVIDNCYKGSLDTNCINYDDNNDDYDYSSLFNNDDTDYDFSSLFGDDDDYDYSSLFGDDDDYDYSSLFDGDESDLNDVDISELKKALEALEKLSD